MLFSTVFILSACSGGGNSSSSSSTTMTTSTAQVVDSPVAGLAYVCGRSSGLTDLAGNFSYISGSGCTFSVGNITVGSISTIPQDGLVTPQEFAGVSRSNTADLNALAVAQFLQSIDSGTTSGVITISSAVTAALSSSSVPAQSILTNGLCFGFTDATSCQAKLAALVSTATAGKKTLVSTATAKIALDAGMVALTVSNLEKMVPSTKGQITICDSSNTNNGSQFALCSASTCVATGGQITVAKASGGTAVFPEMKCTCPVLTGPSIAEVNAGNMTGSCNIPSASAKYPKPIWSVFSATTMFPQQSASPSFSSNIGSGQTCPGTGSQMASNCWNFLCTIDAVQTSGVTTASCYCPLGEDASGNPVAAGTSFYTAAGGAVDPATGKASTAKQAEACSSNPVGAPFTLPSNF